MGVRQDPFGGYGFRLRSLLPALFWIWYAVGLAIQLVFELPASWRFANGVFIVLYGVYAASLLFASAQEEGRHRLLAGALAVGALGFAAEAVGLHTGVPFGRYAYTETLGYSLLGVPVAVAFAWIGVTLNGVLLACSRHPLRRAAEAGLWALSLDLVLDPVAAVSGMWTWAPQGGAFYDGVPWQNFAAWFALAALFSLTAPVHGGSGGSERTGAGGRWNETVWLYQGMLLMFGLLAVKAGMYGPAAWSLAAIAAAEWRRRSR